MNEFLEKAKKYSKGCIDDPEEIDKITSRLLHSRLEELRTGDYNVLFWGEDVLLQLDLPHDDPESLLFGELLEMTRLNCMSMNSPEYARWLKFMLERTSVTLNSVKMFMMISVKAFMQFMDSRSGGSRCMKNYESILEKADMYFHFHDEGSMTFEQFFKNMGNCFCWKNTQPLEEFNETAYAACEIIKMLIADSIYEGYGSEFGMGKIRSRIKRKNPGWNFENFDKRIGPLYKKRVKKKRKISLLDDPDRFEEYLGSDEFEQFYEEVTSGPRTMEERIKEMLKKNPG